MIGTSVGVRGPPFVPCCWRCLRGPPFVHCCLLRPAVGTALRDAIYLSIHGKGMSMASLPAADMLAVGA